MLVLDSSTGLTPYLTASNPTNTFYDVSTTDELHDAAEAINDGMTGTFSVGGGTPTGTYTAGTGVIHCRPGAAMGQIPNADGPIIFENPVWLYGNNITISKHPTMNMAFLFRNDVAQEYASREMRIYDINVTGTIGGGAATNGTTSTVDLSGTHIGFVFENQNFARVIGCRAQLLHVGFAFVNTDRDAGGGGADGQSEHNRMVDCSATQCEVGFWHTRLSGSYLGTRSHKGCFYVNCTAHRAYRAWLFDAEAHPYTSRFLGCHHWTTGNELAANTTFGGGSTRLTSGEVKTFLFDDAESIEGVTILGSTEDNFALQAPGATATLFQFDNMTGHGDRAGQEILNRAEIVWHSINSQYMTPLNNTSGVEDPRYVFTYSPQDPPSPWHSDPDSNEVTWVPDHFTGR